MKRCHRFFDNPNDPYLQFNFEKSLRKYEKIPYKKIKHDHDHSPHRPCLTLLAIGQHENLLDYVEIAKENESSPHEQQCSMNPAVEVCHYSKDENSVISVKKQTGESLELKETTSKVQSRETIGMEQPSNVPEQPLENLQSNQSLDKLQSVQLVHSEFSDPSIVQDTLQHQNQTETDSGGRFHLNSKIFVSKRSLERLVKLGSNKCMEKLLKNRSYLSAQREQIYLRLKEYMGFQ